MGFVRALVSPDGTIRQPMRAGVGFIANPRVFEHDADAALAVTANMLMGGFIIQTTALGADRIFTLPIADDLDTEWPDMDIGDAWTFVISAGHTGAFDIIIAGNTGVTLQSTGNVVLQTSRTFVIVKTGSNAYDVF